MRTKSASYITLLGFALLSLAACSKAPTDTQGTQLASQYGTVNNDEALDIAVNDGVIYSVGHITYPDNSGYSTYHRYNRYGAFLFRTAFNDGWPYSEAQGVAADGSGNVYIVGYGDSISSPMRAYLRKYQGNTMVWQRNIVVENGSAMDSDGWVGVSGQQVYTITASRIFESLLSKYSNSGTLLWSRSLYGWARGTGAVDASGNVYALLDNAGEFKLEKYTSSGSRVWSRILVYSDRYTDIAINSANELYLAGYRYLYEGGPYTPHEPFVARYDSGTGQPVRGWTDTCTPPASKVVPTSLYSTDIVVLGSSVYLLGKAQGEGYGSRGLLCKFAPETSPYPYIRLKQAWSRTIGLNSTTGNAVAVNASEEILVVGTTRENLGAGNLGGFDAFIRKYNSLGTTIWTR